MEYIKSCHIHARSRRFYTAMEMPILPLEGIQSGQNRRTSVCLVQSRLIFILWATKPCRAQMQRVYSARCKHSRVISDRSEHHSLFSEYFRRLQCAQSYDLTVDDANYEMGPHW